MYKYNSIAKGEKSKLICLKNFFFLLQYFSLVFLGVERTEGLGPLWWAGSYVCFLVSPHTWEWHVLSVLRWEWVQSGRYGCRLAGRQRDVGCLHVAFILHGVIGKWAALITVGQKARARGSQEGSFTRICKRYWYLKVTKRRLWNGLRGQGQAKDPESESWLSNESGNSCMIFSAGDRLEGFGFASWVFVDRYIQKGTKQPILG